jgi:O-antigen/teichoic acid export membrane protein
LNTGDAPVRFAAGSFQIFRRDVLVYGSQLVTGTIIARVLGPGAMGLWIALQMIPSYAEALGRIHFDSAACFFINRGTHRFGRVAFAVVTVSVTTAGLMVALFWWQQDLLFRTLLAPAQSTPGLAVLMVAYIPLRFLGLNYSYLLLSREDVRGYNTVAVLTGLFPSVLGAVLLLAGGGVRALVLALLAGGVAAVAYGVVRVHGREPMEPHTDLQIFRDLATFGAKLYTQTLISYFFVYLSGLLVLMYLPAAQLAFFRMGQERAFLLSRVPAAVGVLLYPRVARLGDQQNEAAMLATWSFRIALWILVVFGAVLALVAQPLVLLLYGRAFNPVTLPLLIFIPGVVIDSATTLIVSYFTGRGRLWLIVALNLTGLVIQIAFLAIAVPRWGMIGAAVTTSLAYAFIGALRMLAFHHLEKVRFTDMLVPRAADAAFVTRFITDQVRDAWRRVTPGARKAA